MYLILLEYSLHCFGKLRGCRQRTGNTQLYNVLQEYQVSYYFQATVYKLQKEKKMMQEHTQLRRLLVCIVNLYTKYNCFVKILQTFVSLLNSLFKSF